MRSPVLSAPRRPAPATLALLIAAVLAGLSCSTVPLTGRKQLNLVPESEMLSTSFQQYGDFVKQNKISADRTGAERVRTVGTRIKGAVEQYMSDHGLADRLKGYAWEFNLVESKEVNAWCMPGGKVVVYTGILPLTRDDQGLAVVLGHEIAHAIAEHGNERMSQEMITQFGGSALSELLKSKPAQTQQLWMGVFGAGAQYGVLLPYSRTHESEADHLGLIFMAMAGYDPNGALDFWQRMAASSAGKAPPEFMSTHPADETRIAQIRQNLPEALQYYKPVR
jgi:predicted Zn-dependent protease